MVMCSRLTTTIVEGVQIGYEVIAICVELPWHLE